MSPATADYPPMNQTYPTPAGTGKPATRRRGIGPAATMGLVLFAAFVVAGIVGAGAALATYASVSADLPDPTALEKIELPEQSIVYDRTGKIELARFGEFNRQVVNFPDIPPVLVDATTAVEDGSFWDNAGFDTVGIVAAGIDSLRGHPRGASTITQQLVRQRLLSDSGAAVTDLSATRKLREIIQSIRVTEAYPGLEGKQKIMAAYLNQNYYGNESYGVAAAARGYFGVDLKDLTLAQAAILAALPKSPSTYDLVQNAGLECLDPGSDPTDTGDTCKHKGLVVPADSAIVQRRNQVLDLMEQGRTPLTGDTYTAADYEAARKEPVVLAAQQSSQWQAPAVRVAGPQGADDPAVWRRHLDLRQARARRADDHHHARHAPPGHRREVGEGGDGRPQLEDAQGDRRGARPQVRAVDEQPAQQGPAQRRPDRDGLPDRRASWRTSDRRTRTRPRARRSSSRTSTSSPNGWRQPGSAFKPVVYSTGIANKSITAASMFMDVVTNFGGGYTPTDADNLERGPVRMRDALSFSLNIPAVKAGLVIGNDNIQKQAEAMGVQFQNGKVDATAAFPLGVEVVHPIDLIRAYGVLGDKGKLAQQTTIISVVDSNGEPVHRQRPRARSPRRSSTRAPRTSRPTSWPATRTPTRTRSGASSRSWTAPKRRPATLKTGTSNEARDLNAYGFIGAPDGTERKSGEYALAVGAWNGNSDNSLVSSPSSPLFSIDVTTYVWQGFMEEATKGWSINGFGGPPDNIERAAVDPWTGLLASPGGPSVDEIFIVGTKPTSVLPNDQRCGVAVLSNAGFEDEHAVWLAADHGWLTRAQHGPGTRGGPQDTRTAYFYNGLYTPVRQVVGRDRRRSGLRGAEREPVVVDRSVRAPDRVGRPVVAAVHRPRALPVAVRVRGADRGAGRHPAADGRAHAGADTRAHARADARAHARADARAVRRTGGFVGLCGHAVSASSQGSGL